ncbi:hypothetical protein HIM_00552 [Hirsutella minnesotensis 3608]|nr:hypothetical protein HIM_00552 [Hirsutella minnesotensis 3608]
MAALAGAATAATAIHEARAVFMAPAGLGLTRRDNNGYKPQLQECSGKGDTCAQVCGAGYDQCASNNPGEAHCYNPTVGETCCMDGSGNSCEKGFYCTNDPSKKNWCCPEGMDLAACAAKFGVTGELKLAKPTSTPPPPPPPTSTPIALVTPEPIPEQTSTPVIIQEQTPTTPAVILSTGFVVPNTTAAIVGPTAGAGSTYVPPQPPAPSVVNVSGAAIKGASSLLLVAVGALALL